MTTGPRGVPVGRVERPLRVLSDGSALRAWRAGDELGFQAVMGVPGVTLCLWRGPITLYAAHMFGAIFEAGWDDPDADSHAVFEDVGRPFAFVLEGSAAGELVGVAVAMIYADETAAVSGFAVPSVRGTDLPLAAFRAVAGWARETFHVRKVMAGDLDPAIAAAAQLPSKPPVPAGVAHVAREIANAIPGATPVRLPGTLRLSQGVADGVRRRLLERGSA